MNKTTKNMVGIGGIASTLLGITLSIPGFFNEMYVLAIIASLFIVGGVFLIAIAFGD